MRDAADWGMMLWDMTNGVRPKMWQIVGSGKLGHRKAGQSSDGAGRLQEGWVGTRGVLGAFGVSKNKSCSSGETTHCQGGKMGRWGGEEFRGIALGNKGRTTYKTKGRRIERGGGLVSRKLTQTSMGSVKLLGRESKRRGEKGGKTREKVCKMGKGYCVEAEKVGWGYVDCSME